MSFDWLVASPDWSYIVSDYQAWMVLISSITFTFSRKQITKMRLIKCHLCSILLILLKIKSSVWGTCFIKGQVSCSQRTSSYSYKFILQPRQQSEAYTRQYTCEPAKKLETKPKYPVESTHPNLYPNIDLSPQGSAKTPFDIEWSKRYLRYIKCISCLFFRPELMLTLVHSRGVILQKRLFRHITSLETNVFQPAKVPAYEVHLASSEEITKPWSFAERLTKIVAEYGQTQGIRPYGNA